MNNTLPHSRFWGLAVVHIISLLVSRVGPWVLAIALIRAVADSALALSGADNLFGAWIQFSTNLKVTRGFAFVFGAVGFVYGVQQRRLRLLEKAQSSARTGHQDFSRA